MLPPPPPPPPPLPHPTLFPLPPTLATAPTRLHPSYGWRAALVVPGTVGVVFAVVSFVGLRPFDPPKPTTKTSFTDIVVALQKDVFTSPAMWCMGVGYFFISIIRTAVSTWAFSMLSGNAVGGPVPPPPPRLSLPTHSSGAMHARVCRHCPHLPSAPSPVNEPSSLAPCAPGQSSSTMVPTFLFVLEAGSFVGGIGAGTQWASEFVGQPLLYTATRL
jgi:hypothetical protein